MLTLKIKEENYRKFVEETSKKREDWIKSISDSAVVIMERQRYLMGMSKQEFYGVFLGLITFLIRHFGSMNEGMSYAILLGNLMTPWFNAWGHQTPLGYKKPKKAKKGGAE